MKYILLLFCTLTHTMYRESNSSNVAPYVHVETVTRVLKENTAFIDADNNNLVSDSHSVVEVTLNIHRPGKAVKKIVLNVDI